METMELELPNGIQQPDGVWTKRMEISEWIGDDENALVDQTREAGKGTYSKSFSQRILGILSRCTVRVGNVTRPDGKDRFTNPAYFEGILGSAYSDDRSFMVIRLRQLSLGNEYKFSETCSDCKKELKRVTVDLSTLEVTDIPLEVAAMSTHTLKLPRSGAVVEWRFLKVGDDRVIEEIVKTRKADFLTAIMAQRIASVDGGTPEGGCHHWLNRLAARDRRALADAFDSTGGGIDTTLQITCDNPECGHEFSKRINVSGKSDFFFPSATPSNTRSSSALSQKPGDGPQNRSPESPSVVG